MAGSFKANRIIGDSEARRIIDEWNAGHKGDDVLYDWPRESGADFEPTDEANERYYSLKEGNLSDIMTRVVDLFEKAKAGEFVGKPKSIARISPEGKSYLEKLSGLKLKEELDFVLNPSDLNHIRSDHYGENEKDKGNNVPLEDEDIQSMVDVLNQPDGILYGVDKSDGRKLFFFLKDAGNGLYNLAEVCSTKKGNLTAKSFFKSKKKGISQRVMEIKKSLLPTSVTYSGEFLSSDAKIPTMLEIDKENNTETGHEQRLSVRSGRNTVGHTPVPAVSEAYENAVKDTRNKTLLNALATSLWTADGRKSRAAMILGTMANSSKRIS